MENINYKILWQQLANYLIDKRKFKTRHKVNADKRFLEIFQQYWREYKTQKKAAKKLYNSDDFIHLKALDRFYARLGKDRENEKWMSLIRKWENLKNQKKYKKYIWIHRFIKPPDN